jgi:hypothetical protein
MIKYLHMHTIDMVKSICEEFTDVILVDHKKNSVIINVKKQWFTALNTRLKSLRFKLVHKTTIKTGYTCTYVFAGNEVIEKPKRSKKKKD